MLTRNGYIYPDDSPEIKRELTVRPVTNALGNFGQGGPSFKVFRRVAPSSRTETASLVIPRYFGIERFGPPTRVHLHFYNLISNY
jgi:hypothetical protein